VLAAAVAAASIACRPAPDLGTLTYTRGKIVHVVDLATCRDRKAAAAPLPSVNPVVSPNGRFRASVHHDTIVATNLRSHRSFDVFRGPHAVMLLGWSPDSRWILFAIDPMASASIAADGLRLQAVAVVAGGVVRIAPMLMYDDYRAWCGGRLVLTAGGDRIATTNKRLVVTRPGAWRARALVRSPGRAFGSLACADDGRSIVVQSQPATGVDMSLDHSHWSLWRVGLDGSLGRVTSPPVGYSDDSPVVAGDAVFFVRSRHGLGRIYASRAGKLYGPFATVDRNSGYYGHRAWDFRVTR
jgi:hypothetical protein